MGEELITDSWPKLPVKICKSVGPRPQSIDDVCYCVLNPRFTFTFGTAIATSVTENLKFM